ncbi:MAG: DNA polymerase/3'-5' exonuclease PolX [Chloroflexi bacterium]|nr:DNA polymerase/3'-5' exonuclease PolX [Chloroflexota bacterium]
MNNAQIADILDAIASLLELKGEERFKVVAYQRAARAIALHPKEMVLALKEGDDLRAIPGIGKSIAEKIEELVRSGRLEYFEELKAQFPPGVTELLHIPGVGPKTALKLVQELGVTSLEELEAAVADGRVAGLPGLGAKSAENIERRLRELRAKERRIPLGAALPIAEELLAGLRQVPGVRQASAAGSLRRFRETVGDIDLMGTADDPPAAIAAFVALPQVKAALAQGPTKATVLVHSGLQVDLRLVEHQDFGSLLQHFTGSKEHNVALREWARRRGYSVSEYGIAEIASGRVHHFQREEEVYRFLGLQFIPPEIREARGEIELAARGALPRLVEADDIRGDLHAHTDWTDGQDSLEAMVRAARERGYAYLAITDHSVGRGITNGLSVERLREQRKLLQSVEQQVGGIRVFHGTEVDIRADGTLDYPDEVLAELDVVVASLHSALQQPAERMTERVLRALANPHVDVFGHPSARLLGERPPVELDWEAVFHQASRTGVALEINASPGRLDLKDVHVSRARELGCRFLVNTDAHAARHFAAIRYGVGVARRAWCESQHILNSRPLAEFEDFLYHRQVVSGL